MSKTPQEQTGTASHDPDRPAALLEFMTSGWVERPDERPAEEPGAAYRARRRGALSARFPGEWIVVPTGGFKTRANDTEFRFRPGTEFAYLVGSHQPNAVLVIDGAGEAVADTAAGEARPAPRFFPHRMVGGVWGGPRPSPGPPH